MKKDNMKYTLNSICCDCVDTDAICAHSFQEKCTATHYDHLCDEMKDKFKDKDISKLLGN